MQHAHDNFADPWTLLFDRDGTDDVAVIHNAHGVELARSRYFWLPEGDDPAKHPENLAGSITLFGVRKASLVDDKHAGNGLTFVLEITHIIDTLHLAGALKANQLQVRLVPLNPVPEAAQISIGRISVFRQGT